MRRWVIPATAAIVIAGAMTRAADPPPATRPRVDANTLFAGQGRKDAPADVPATGFVISNRGVFVEPDGLAVSPEHGRVLAATQGSVWRLFDFSGKELATLDYQGHIYGAAFSPDGRYVAGCSYGSVAHVWDATTGRKVRDIDAGASMRLSQLAFAPDGSVLYGVGGNGGVHIYDMGTGQQTGRLGDGEVWRMAASDDGRLLAAALGDTTKRLAHPPPGGPPPNTPPLMLQVWDAVSKKPVCRIEEPDGGWYSLQTLTFAHGAVLVANFSRNRVDFWNARAGRATGWPQRSSRKGGGIWSQALSHDGKRLLLTDSEGHAAVQDAMSGDTIQEFHYSMPGFLQASSGRLEAMFLPASNQPAVLIMMGDCLELIVLR